MKADELNKLFTGRLAIESLAFGALDVLLIIHDKLTYEDIFNWDDGDECWDKMREICAAANNLKTSTK